MKVMDNKPDGARAVKISLDQTFHFDREGFSGDVYISNDDACGFTALKVSVHGKHPRKQILDGNTRTYYVIDGNGTFTVGLKQYEVQGGDMYVIPAGSEYEYVGEMTMFEFNVSPDNTFGDKKL